MKSKIIRRDREIPISGDEYNRLEERIASGVEREMRRYNARLLRSEKIAESIILHYSS